MISGMRVPAKSRREEGEKPFWISFADLMTALMVLFLISMAAALVIITKGPSDDQRLLAERAGAMQEVTNALRELIQKDKREEYDGIRIDGVTVDFGTRGRFEKEGQNTLSPRQRDMVVNFTKDLLVVLRKPKVKEWFKRTIVEGYASQTGTYLFNLNLSLERSERVICELLRDPGDGINLEAADRVVVAQSFLVGGASFNKLQGNLGNAKESAEASRRTEYRLEFKTLDEYKADELNRSKVAATNETVKTALVKALDPKEQCPITSR